MKINFEKILQEQPNLTPFGIEGRKTIATPEMFDEDYRNQIETCIAWLSSRSTQKSINRNVSSYSIKHMIERETKTYVANGCLIAAVIQLGIPYRRIGKSPNICIAIGMKELYRYHN